MAYKKLSANLKKRKSESSAIKRKKESFFKKKSRVKASLKRKKLAKKELLIKPKDNLIIMPIADHDWEAWQVFNPGVIVLEDRIHFIYRAIGVDGISRFGYASSPDGFLIDERLPHPVYEHPSLNSGLNYYSFGSGGSFGGAEDARLTRVDNEDNIFMTYTACDEGLRVALTSIKVDDFLKKNWQWEKPVLISPPGEVHKNWVIFPEKINGQYAILHSLRPRVLIAYRDNLNFQKGEYINSFYDGYNEETGWEIRIRGAGAPPIKTKYGWLVFYHANDKSETNKYKVGAMLLDLMNPETILMRSSRPILEPDEPFQSNGFKPGIVYVSGAVVKNETLFIYYGVADNYICVAWANFDEFLNDLVQQAKPKLKQKVILNKKDAR
ncbi:MAG TPA: hypothetical protein PLR11_01050 [Candidatus Paceibacterota bacterium]|nr:hypothetical protein [Candidatus Paceibacterota bacterium]